MLTDAVDCYKGHHDAMRIWIYCSDGVASRNGGKIPVAKLSRPCLLDKCMRLLATEGSRQHERSVMVYSIIKASRVHFSHMLPHPHYSMCVS